MTKKLTFISVFLGCFLTFIGLAYASTYLNVSLSPNTPPGGYISATSTNVAFTSFNFQNATSSTESLIINKLTVYNTGTSSSTPQLFTNLYLYDQNDLIATSTNTIGNNFVFNGFSLIIPTSTTKTLTIKGDLGSGATSQQTIRIGIKNSQSIKSFDQSTSTPSTIYGNFPILGNFFTIL